MFLDFLDLDKFLTFLSALPLEKISNISSAPLLPPIITLLALGLNTLRANTLNDPIVFNFEITDMAILLSSR